MFANITIKMKLVCALLFIGVLSIAIIGFQGYTSGKTSLEQSSFNQLTAVRGSKARQIEAYFAQIRSQMLTFSQNRMVVEAMKNFTPSFHGIVEEKGVTEDQLAEHKASVKKYYDTEFLPRLHNNLTDEAAKKGFDNYDAGESVFYYLQSQYISENPNEVGSKHELDFADDGSAYAGHHAKYHPVIRSYLNEFGYYDIFLLDHETGHIVYSVFKEADYATSLTTGPYNNTNFAEAFKAAAQASDPDFIKLFDFRNYQPSYDAPASFIASPIFDGDEKVGVAIFQMPVDVINGIMTGNESWEADGLGASGETYLVGEDFKMRSISRFLVQDKEGYFAALRDVDVSDDLIAKIDKIGTSLGLQEVRTEASVAALNGQTNTSIVKDYRGVNVLSSYTPLKIEDVKWAILSEIDEEEAFAPVDKLFKQLAGWGAGIIILTVVLALIFSRTIATPIGAVATRLNDISEGEGDLTQRLENLGTDEVGQVGMAFNSFVEKIQNILKDVSTNTQSLTKASGTLATTSNNMSSGASEMSNAIKTVVAATEEMSSTIAEVSKSTSEASRIATDANKQAQSASETIERLSNSANEIGKVVDTIKDIADQTNLLALNATIEAASAGDAGKGFAVVANEVKELARQTANATDEIGRQVGEIQSNTGSAVSSMANVAGVIDDLTKIAQTIASAVEEQSATTNEVSGNITHTAKLASDTSEGATESNNYAKELAELASRLSKLVEQFKV